ncbi:MAG: transglutaminase family protein [Alphaproteobacteria bacterium]|nr:transglutaminase family protein [Alphaproteobacteria bacterium]
MVAIASGSGKINRDHETVSASNFLFKLLCSRLRKLCIVAPSRVRIIQDMKKFLYFALIFFTTSAHADLAISNWHEVIQVTKSGRRSTVTIAAQVKDIPQNQAMTGFSIGFDEKRKINITNVLVDDQLVKYGVEENELKITFNHRKTTGALLSIKFTCEEEYDETKINPYLRQELVYVPGFAAGAIATVIINFPGFELTTFNPNAIVSGDSLTYVGPVSKAGLREIVKLTRSSESWLVTVNTKISAQNQLGNLSVKMPKYFQTNRQRVQQSSIDFNPTPIATEKKDEESSAHFRLSGSELTIRNSASIFTGKKWRGRVFRNTLDYNKVSKEESDLLTPILWQIRSDGKYGALPLHVAIGKFVHDTLEYDLSYLNQRPSLQDILKNKAGVCTEFARLYDALARVAGIPSLVIDGVACGEYDKCQGHSWNMIFYDNSWIEVDPTWELMSGTVSSSHVYVNDDGKGKIQIQYPASAGRVEMKMDLVMEVL